MPKVDLTFFDKVEACEDLFGTLNTAATREPIETSKRKERTHEQAEGVRRDIGGDPEVHDVFQRHDPSALPELVAEDCVIENTVPAPNGARHVGRDACVALWREIATTPGTHFDLEDVVVVGDRAIIRWRFWWGEGESNSVRGVNLMRVRDGLIVEAMGYVKGAPNA